LICYPSNRAAILFGKTVKRLAQGRKGKNKGKGGARVKGPCLKGLKRRWRKGLKRFPRLTQSPAHTHDPQPLACLDAGAASPSLPDAALSSTTQFLCRAQNFLKYQYKN
jgi:hypothetical protein